MRNVEMHFRIGTILASLSIIFSSCSSKFQDFTALYQSPHPPKNFEEIDASYQITLTGIEKIFVTLVGRNGISAIRDPDSMNVVYAVNISQSLSEDDGTIYLRLLDSNGLEFSRPVLQCVSKSYIGSLKGNFSLSSEDYVKISKSELIFVPYVRKEEAVD